MLTDAALRDLLGAGYETSDADFVAHFKEHTSRTVYLMAQFLAQRQQQHRYIYLSSRDLQDQIDERLRTGGFRPTKKFNPVDWFSEEWTQAKDGHPTTKYFVREYLELFDRDGKNLRSDKNPWQYRIKPALHESAVRVLSELARATPSRSTAQPGRRDPNPQAILPGATTGGATFSSLNGSEGAVPDLLGVAAQLDKEGVFNPTSPEDARVRALRAVVVREGQPQFRAALLVAYRGLCAITACDATPALEAAHVKPYEGLMTNVVTNGILLRADIHTLFDLDLIGIDPSEMLVHISTQLLNTVYHELDGAPLRGPDDPSASPNRAALAWRWQRFLGQR